MKKVSLALILISCVSTAFSQYLNPNNFDEYVWRRFDASIYNASDLFDSCEIQDRKIKSAALLQLYEGTKASDTLFIYYFDNTGKAIAQVSFTVPSQDSEGDSYVRDKVYDLSAVNNTPSEKDRYVMTRHTLYGTERKTYSSESDEMLDSEFIITLNCGSAYVQTNDRSELITYRLEEGSALIGRITSIQLNEDYYATHYIIRYNAN